MKNKESEEVKELKGSWLTGSLIIAGLTAVSYCYAYLYEKGYAEVFNIPTDLIEINVISIMVVAISLLGVLAYLFITAYIIVKNIPSLSKALTLKLAVVSVPIAMFIFQLLIFGTRQSEKWFVFAMFAIGTICYEFVIPFFTQRDKKTYKKKLEADYERRMGKKCIGDYIPVSKIIKRRVAAILLVLAIAYLASYDIGKAVATYKKRLIVKVSG